LITVRGTRRRRIEALLLAAGMALLLAAPAASAATFSFAGTVTVGGTAFRSHTFPVTEASTITAILDWNDPSADLNLFLYNPSGAFVKGTGGSTAKPETITYQTGTNGTWKLGVKAMAGSASYTLSVDVTASGGGDPVAPTYIRTIGGPGHAEMYPSGLDVSSQGTLFIADTGSSQVAALGASGEELWRVGTRGSGALARYLYPRDVAFAAGKLYIGDTGNGRVVVVDATDGSPLSQWTGFSGLMGISAGVSGAGDPVILVTEDQKHQVQVRSLTGSVIRTIGTGSGTGNGQLRQPRDAATDAAGNVYVADYLNNRIAKFSPTGTWIKNWGVTGSGAGAFNRPYGVDVDDADGVYVADSNNHRIQKFDSQGAFIRAWGSMGSGAGQFEHLRRVAVGSGPSPDVYGADLWRFKVERFGQGGAWLQTFGGQGPPSGRFNEPSGVAVDSAVFVIDALNQRAHRFDLTGGLQLTWGHRGWGTDLSGFGWARDIALSAPTSTVWVADTRGQRLLEFTRDGVPTGRSIGTGSPGSGNLVFNWPTGIATVGSDLIVADTNNNRVQRIDPSGPSVVWTATGFNKPEDVTVAGSSVFVADSRNKRVVKLNASTGGVIDTFVNSNLHYPGGVAVDAAGNVWVADSTWNRLLEFSPTGALRQTFGRGGTGHGEFTYPTKIEIVNGMMYVSDQWGDRIEVFQLGG
jgi:sugar lactone lactonase YvrE